MAFAALLAVRCGNGPAPTGVGSGTTGVKVPPSVDAQLMINEIMVNNAVTIRDDKGAASPWIEIYNPTQQDIALGGYALTDDFAMPRTSVLPDGVVAPAGGYLILWANSDATAGPTHVSLLLSSGGGALGLARPDGSFIDRISYGAQQTDISAAREPDGSNNWVVEWNVSPGAANPNGSGQPMPPQAASDPPESVPAAGDMSDRVLGYDAMPEFDLQIADADIASLRSNPDSWVAATITFQGRSYGPVGVNLKGTASFQTIDQKPGFRVNVNKFVNGARFFGVKDFLLNNMTTDASMMHERLAYWIGRQIGTVPTSRSNHSWVTLNGAPLGLYATVEEPKDPLMAYYFTDSSGSVYTINYADFQTAYLPDFLLQDGNGDLTLITDATNALAMTPADAAIAAAGPYVNLHEFARYWALCVLTGHWGGWPYAAVNEPVGANAGVYADPTSNQLYFIPEGINDAFMTADFDFMKEVRSVLAENCAASASCYQDFATQLNEIMGTAQQLDWASEHDRVAAQIAPYVAMDPKMPFTAADVAEAQTQMRYFITGRPAYITEYLRPAGQPPGPPPPGSMPPTDGGTTTHADAGAPTTTPDAGTPTTTPDAGVAPDAGH
jgi:hypothetical protein